MVEILHGLLQPDKDLPTVGVAFDLRCGRLDEWSRRGGVWGSIWRLNEERDKRLAEVISTKKIFCTIRYCCLIFISRT